MRLNRPEIGKRSNMLDINYIKENLDKVKKGITARGLDPKQVDQLLERYDIWTEKLQEYDALRHKRNEIAKGGKYSDEGKELKQKLPEAEKANFAAWESYEELATQMPNIPLEDVPVGSETNKKVLRNGGTPKKLDNPKDHVEIGELLGILDITRATKVSGARFAFLKNEGVILEFALVQFALEKLIKEGFTPIIPPALIKKDLTEKLGYWHAGGNENYYLVSDYHIEGMQKGNENPLYLIGTGEHVIVPMHMDEVLEEKDLPKKYVAFSPCFRREAGSYGKDTRGILRVHQFDKVEMVQFVKPEDDEKERKKMLEIVEKMMQLLGLPYQVVKLAAGDLSLPAAETIDIETWIPSQGQYRETHSISTTTDFQSRRLNIKYSYVDAVTHKPSDPTYPGQIKSGFFPKHGYVHILNGTAFAIGRTIIAILENFQQEDGSVKIPEVLHKYTGFSKIEPKK